MDKKKLWNVLRPYLFISPAMIGIGLFVIYPMVYLVYLSFFDYNLMNKSQSEFIGFENYLGLFTRSDFYKALSNTLLYTGGAVFITTALALLTAVWLSKKTRFNSFIQAGIFIPHIISIVSISLVWLWIMEPNMGLLNFLLNSVGLPGLQWLQSSDTALISIIIVAVWQSIGYYALILIAAIQGISPNIYEAATLDNAKRHSVLSKITLPMISPQMFFILIIMTINSFKVFETVHIMTGGGPNNATTTLVYYIYNFRTTNIGFASASSVVLMIIIGIFIFIYFRIIAKRVHYQ